MTQMRQSRPDSGLGFQGKIFDTFQVVASSLVSGWNIESIVILQVMRQRNLTEVRDRQIERQNATVVLSSLGSAELLRERVDALIPVATSFRPSVGCAIPQSDTECQAAAPDGTARLAGRAPLPSEYS